MNRDVTLQMLRELNSTLQTKNTVNNGWGTAASKHVAMSAVANSLAGRSRPPESVAEMAKLRAALDVLSPDVDRGNGSFYLADGSPAPDIWLAVVWALAGTGWACSKQLAKDWSMRCATRYTEDGFEKAWNSFDPHHPNPVGLGSLYKRTAELGLMPDALAVTGQHAPRYKLLSKPDIDALPPIDWCIKGVFPSAGLAAVYGQSASGKSFLALDMAAAIAAGTTWFGHRVKKMPVVYAALEGEMGFKLRVKAWELEQKAPLPTGLHMVMQPFVLTERSDVADLASVITKGSVILIDTLNRAAPTSDENSSKEMGAILEGAKRLHSLTQGLVILIHHTGKDATQGARGHSSFFAALDGAIETKRAADRRLWRAAKVKDSTDGADYAFKLKVHDLGKDADGDPQTSCTIERDSSAIFQMAEPSGRSQKLALSSLRPAIRSSLATGKAGSGTGTPCIKVEDATRIVAADLTTVASNKRNNRARKLVSDLIHSQHLSTGMQDDEGWVWIP